MSFDSLHDLLVNEMQDLYSAETQLVRELPAMQTAAESVQLKALIGEHLEQTRIHVARLEAGLELIHEPAVGKRCRAMEGLLEEGAEVAKGGGSHVVRDAGIISAAQRVEHYEIAAYGSALAFARLLEYDPIVSLLGQTLDEERAADLMLTMLADAEVNPAAKRLYGTRDPQSSIDAIDERSIRAHSEDYDELPEMSVRDDDRRYR